MWCDCDMSLSLVLLWTFHSSDPAWLRISHGAKYEAVALHSIPSFHAYLSTCRSSPTESVAGSILDACDVCQDKQIMRGVSRDFAIPPETRLS